SRDIQIHAGQSAEHHAGSGAALQYGEALHVPATALAGIDGARRAAFLQHERDELSVIRHDAKWARQIVSLPLGATAAAAQGAAALDAAHFGQGRPGAAYGAISFRPAFGDRAGPPAAARLQERDRHEGRDRLE